eukprot:Colp12_sorted_trinity150504_noHs@10670
MIFVGDHPSLKVEAFGISFPNPLGLAAGFDKHGEAIDGMLRTGFGFVEIGSVTPLPQPGNPKPRVFRLKPDEAVINRYGFNSEGVVKVAERLSNREKKERPAGILGINLGKNKTSDSAAVDYSTGMEVLGSYADYVVINVSSPNTPGLRVLQGKEELLKILDSVFAAREKLDMKGRRRPPLLIKIAPDLNQEDMKDIAEVALTSGIDGLIVSNTTIDRPETLSSPHKQETGGLSGRPLFEKSTKALSEMYRLTQGKVPLIGVGGITNGDDAYAKIRAGATLVQLYTGIIYGGPALIPSIKKRIAERLAQDGFKSVAEAVGADHRN